MSTFETLNNKISNLYPKKCDFLTLNLYIAFTHIQGVKSMQTKDELRKEYDEIWDQIRYKKLNEISAFTEEIIGILENHIDDKLLFNGDYEKILHLFKKMKWKNYFYMSNDAKQIICLTNPKFKRLFKEYIDETYQ